MKSILLALQKFNIECEPIGRSEKNPYFNSKYATLDSIQKHIKPHLIANNLLVTQAVVIRDERIYVETRVWHTETAEFVESIFPIVVSKTTAQEYGSSVSYAKRYSLSGLLNLIIQDEDDDGNVATGFSSKKTAEKISSTAASGYSTTTVTESDAKQASVLPQLSQEKYDAMVKYINDGKIKEVEAAIKKYTLSPAQEKVIVQLINQAKAEIVKKSAKK